MLAYLRQLSISPSGQLGILVCLLSLAATPGYAATAASVADNPTAVSPDGNHVPTVPRTIAVGTPGYPTGRPAAGDLARRLSSEFPTGTFPFDNAGSNPVTALPGEWTVTAGRHAIQFEPPDNGVFRRSRLRSAVPSRSISDLADDVLQPELGVHVSATEPDFCHASDPFRAPSRRGNGESVAAPAPAAARLFSAGLVTLLALTRRGNGWGAGR